MPKGLKLEDSSEGTLDLEVDCMIGADYYWTLVTDEVKRGLIPGPVAIRTILGWVLPGPVNAGTSPDTSVHLTSTHVICTQAKSQPKSDCQIREELSKFWQLENFGIESENGTVYDRF